MAKGKAKISSSEDLAPPPARLLRSRKKEAESNDAVLKGNAQASLLLKGLEEGGAAAEPLQECAVIVHQMYQAAECSCLTGPDEATKEKATNESEVISLSTAAPKSSFRSNKNQTESWAGEDAAEEGSKRQRAEKHKREVEGRREQQHSTMAFPAKKRRRMGSCGLTDGERSRVLGNYEKKPSFVKGAGMKVCNDSDTPLRSSGHESGQKQAEPKQVELQSAEPKQAELQSAEPKQEELQSAEPKQAELQSAEPKQAELQSAEPKQAKLQSAEPKQAELQSAKPKQAELQSAEPKQEELQSAEPKQEELQSAEPKQAELHTAEPKQTELQSAEPMQEELQSAEPKQAELHTAEPKQAELQSAEPKQAELHTAEPKQAELQSAEPKQAELQSAEPKQAELQSAEPKQAELQSAEPKQAELQSAEPKQAELQSAEPKQAELQSAEPKQAELQSAEPKQAELQSAGEDARAPTEAPMSVLYRGECDPDSESAKGVFSESPEESNRQQAEEESISQSVNRAEGGASSTEAPTSGPALQPEETAEPGEACNGGPTGDLAAAKAAPSSGGDSHGACGCSDDVSDSQLNTIVFTEELMEDVDAGPSGCLEDATELLCGIISELSSANRRVMAAHRELQNLRRFKSKASRNSTHRER
ncbi:uncharacterized protein LOC101155010 isoform X2 [Oryzias latipes]